MSVTKGRFFPVQAIGLGQFTSFATVNTATLGGNGDPATGEQAPWYGQLGMIIEDSGAVYKLVQKKNTADVATTAGFVAYWKDTTFQIVTSKASETAAAVNGVAGAFLGVITNSNYCFIQIGGLQTIGSKDATSAGDMLFGSTTDGQMATIAAGSTVTNNCFAIAYGTASANLVVAKWNFGDLLV